MAFKLKPTAAAVRMWSGALFDAAHGKNWHGRSLWQCGVTCALPGERPTGYEIRYEFACAGTEEPKRARLYG